MSLFILVTTIISLFAGIFWTIPIFVGSMLVGFGLYRITDDTDVGKIRKFLVNNCTVMDNNKRANGFIFGMWFVGYVHETEDFRSNVKIYIVCTKNQYEKLTNHDRVDAPLTKPLSTIVMKVPGSGTKYNQFLADRKCVIRHQPRDNQQDAIDKILEMYN